MEVEGSKVKDGGKDIKHKECQTEAVEGNTDDVSNEIEELRKTNNALATGIASLARTNEMFRERLEELKDDKKNLNAMIPCQTPNCNQSCGRAHQEKKQQKVCWFQNSGKKGCFRKDNCRDLHVIDESINPKNRFDK